MSYICLSKRTRWYLYILAVADLANFTQGLKFAVSCASKINQATKQRGNGSIP